VEQLCDELCYRLELAYFVAHVNSGKGRLASSARIFSKIGSKAAQEDDDDDYGAPANSFAANLVLERLAMHSPVRVRILRSQQVNPSKCHIADEFGHWLVTCDPPLRIALCQTSYIYGIWGLGFMVVLFLMSCA
jgi:hypothetical protein